MLAHGAHQVDSASERIKLGQYRARAGWKRTERPSPLPPEQVIQCRGMAEERAGLRHMARLNTCLPATVRKALDTTADGSFRGYGDGQLQRADTSTGNLNQTQGEMYILLDHPVGSAPVGDPKVI